MNFHPISENDLQFFRQLIGEHSVFTDEESRQKYSHDETEDLMFPPEAILKPSSPEQISAILKYCNEKKIAVTPRAAGTGLSGGALPVHAGVILSIEKLNTF